MKCMPKNECRNLHRGHIGTNTNFIYNTRIIYESKKVTDTLSNSCNFQNK